METAAPGPLPAGTALATLAKERMADITSINQKRTFGFAEAQRLLPVVRRITQESVVRSEALALRYEALPQGHPSRDELEQELNDLILGWAAKIQKLGADA